MLDLHHSLLLYAGLVFFIMLLGGAIYGIAFSFLWKLGLLGLCLLVGGFWVIDDVFGRARILHQEKVVYCEDRRQGALFSACKPRPPVLLEPEVLILPAR